ncbi:helix-turn-helix domain-containing protein [Mesonia aestuariivivens]|uniref:Helix-turn-helix domain-containing protein n=1 Tax=Mesonia aestuariivivens TaxID=2796128 RepID=A0ABS6W4W7_9FLAO|nr:helix-turn-helix transcriptional regulator [Mesonia aestuariivivens]MBW2962913.1 helix-turn-helix domain-containing protein [Mesonia aestuariivivens]
MSKTDKNEIKLIRIQIGCIIKYERLSKGLSQEELSVRIDTTSTTIGRIERAEHSCNWEILILICNQLNIEIERLFSLKSNKELQLIISNTIDLEKKLTKEKNNYYNSLKKRIEKEFALL